MKYSNALPRVIAPSDLIGTGTAAQIMGVNKTTLTRQIAAGKLEPFSQLDGPGGAFVFDRNEIEARATK